MKRFLEFAPHWNFRVNPKPKRRDAHGIQLLTPLSPTAPLAGGILEIIISVAFAEPPQGAHADGLA